MYLNTVDPIVSPVTNQALIDWARLDESDPTVTSCLTIATSLVISYLKLDLLNRNWSLRFKEWPTVGTNMRDAISPNTFYFRQIVELPNANLQSITSVKINNVLTTDYIILDGNPSALQFDNIATYNSDNYALEVEYVAGYGVNQSNVPTPIRDAILMTAAYISENRGGCSTGSALDMSGAKMLLTPYAIRGGIVL
tara:strand:+ start:588 stop:1175 length:588 start_codon:yes stop_codon:yes gene_type:complete